MKVHDANKKLSMANGDAISGSSLSLMPPTLFSGVTRSAPSFAINIPSISGSVGLGGSNLFNDVITVQTLLNNHKANLDIDGISGPKTIEAIQKFQTDTFGWPNPDGRVDVNGQTWLALLSTPASTGSSENSGSGGTGNSNPIPAGPIGVVNVPPATTTTTATNSSNDILSEINTSGAGFQSTKQDGNFSDFGVDASSRMAKTDQIRIEPYASLFVEIASKHGVPPALLAGIASRETRGNNILTGDGGNGVGIMQVDKRFHPERTQKILNAPVSQQIRVGIEMGGEVFSEMLAGITSKFPGWTLAWQLRGATAAYNAGLGTVQTQAGMDIGTTFDDYSADVWERAKHYASLVGFKGMPLDNQAPPPQQQPTTAPPVIAPPTTAPPISSPTSETTNGEPGTANFNLNEFHSKDGTPVPIELYPNIQALMENLEVIRTAIGNRPLIVSSGYRSPTHNASIPGASSGSKHTLGQAADIVVDGMHPDTVHDIILRLIEEGSISEGGLGRYNFHTHYDIRGTAARWDRR